WNEFIPIDEAPSPPKPTAGAQQADPVDGSQAKQPGEPGETPAPVENPRPKPATDLFKTLTSEQTHPEMDIPPAAPKPPQPPAAPPSLPQLTSAKPLLGLDDPLTLAQRLPLVRTKPMGRPIEVVEPAGAQTGQQRSGRWKVALLAALWLAVATG